MVVEASVLLATAGSGSKFSGGRLRGFPGASATAGDPSGEVCNSAFGHWPTGGWLRAAPDPVADNALSRCHTALPNTPSAIKGIPRQACSSLCTEALCIPPAASCYLAPVRPLWRVSPRRFL